MYDLKIVTFGQARVFIGDQDVVWHASSARDLFFFLLSFPEGRGRRQVSTDGGFYVIGWRHDGKELYYETESGDVMVVPIESTPDDFRYEVPKRLFSLAQGSQGDVNAEGQRFIFAEPGEKQASLPLTVVLNWQAGLKQ